MTTPTHSHKAWTDKGGHVTAGDEWFLEHLHRQAKGFENYGLQLIPWCRIDHIDQHVAGFAVRQAASNFHMVGKMLFLAQHQCAGSTTGNHQHPAQRQLGGVIRLTKGTGFASKPR